MPTLYVGYNRVKLDSKEYPPVLCDMALGILFVRKSFLSPCANDWPTCQPQGSRNLASSSGLLLLQFWSLVVCKNGGRSPRESSRDPQHSYPQLKRSSRTKTSLLPRPLPITNTDHGTT